MENKKGLVEIFPGADENFIVKVIESNTQDPYDLTGFVLTGFIENCNANLVLGPANFETTQPTLGKVRVVLDSLETITLKQGVTSLYLTLTNGPLVKIVKFENKIIVKG